MFIRLQIRDPMARFVAHDEYLQAGFARDSLFLVEAKQRGSRLEIIVERNDDKKFCLIFKGMLFSCCAELDSFERTAGNSYLFDWNCITGNFGELFDSRLMSSFLPRSDVDPASCHHYFLATYDDIFNIIAESVSIEAI